MLAHLYFLPFFCLTAAILVLSLGRWLPWKGSFLGIVAVGWGFFHSFYLLIRAAKHQIPLPYESSFSWFPFGVFEANLGVYVDGLTLVMLFVVTLVSLLVQVYSLGYMHGDPRFKRYYAYLSLFTGAMLGLVLADNMLLFFITWELVGVCSYLLIGFWFEKPEAADAGKKAFITTKFGDIGLFLGILLLFSAAGTFRISQLQAHVQAGYIPVG
ncbi:MAG: NADH-quinone oxidoreductase subunit L, partial [Elusimicrobia bacterium]|nr:NADH-quinone oxidoreductase subunit L [Elusimicrobiota bacterium]